MSFEIQKRIGYLVQLKRRTGSNTWESEWQDITKYFIERVDVCGMEIDDKTLQGKIEQQTVTLRFNNWSGKFNPIETEDSLWETAGYYMYHSRIRYYEFLLDEYSIAEGEEPSFLPIIDGLIAEEPSYYIHGDCTIRVNSMLDILREHYLLDEYIKFNYTSSSSGILKYIANLLTTTYTQLGITSKSGVLRNEIIYENITPYNETLLEVLSKIINDGGGYGGLTRNKAFFSSYAGATIVEKANFEDDATCIGLYLMTDTDYSGGSGTTIYDASTKGLDLTTDNSIYINWASEGYFNNEVKTFYCTDIDATWTDLSALTIELLIKGTSYGETRNQVPPVNSVTYNYTLNPLITFTTKNTSDIFLYDGVNTYYEEGIYYWNTKIYYMYIQRVYGSPSPSPWHIHELTELGPIAGEEFTQYLTFVLSSTNDELYYYFNGKLKKYIKTKGNLGTVYTGSNIKLLGRCFSQDGYSTAATYYGFHDRLMSIYYNSIKISSTLKTASEIFNQYEKIMGVDLVL